jgi:hypothetical protein
MNVGVRLVAVACLIAPGVALGAPVRRSDSARRGPHLSATRSIRPADTAATFCTQRLALTGTYNKVLTFPSEFNVTQLGNSGRTESVLDLQWGAHTNPKLQQVWDLAILLPGRTNHPAMRVNLATTRVAGVELALTNGEKAFADFRSFAATRNGPHGSGTLAVSKQIVGPKLNGFSTFSNDVTGTITAKLLGFSGKLANGVGVRTNGNESIRVTFNCPAGAV